MKSRNLIVVMAFLIIPFAVDAQTADDIVMKYISFTGGVKNWKTIATITSHGEYNYGGMPFPFTTYARIPDSYKLVVPFNGKYYAQAYSSGKGWKIDAFKNETKPTRLAGKEARAMANEADVELENVFINYKAKGHTISLHGEDSVIDRKCFVIVLTRKSGETEKYYFDQQSYSLLMKEAKAKNPELGGAVLNIYYSDYRDVAGVQFPFKTVCESDAQQILTITVTDIEINEMIDNKTFESP
ncbi:hypothetical protein WBG78_10365 [Chryseolinea sp. T2]|uniref:hypothetical protein n=1 Tax=Chryseolinea sp. T2 TaxID=3129255 RepID=UPI003076F1BD